MPRLRQDAEPTHHQISIDLLEGVPIAIVIVNEHGNIVRINARAAAMFGYQRREMVSQPVELLIPSRFKARHENLKANFMFEHATRRMSPQREVFARRKDGSEFPVEVNLATLVSDNGTLVAAAIIDITHQQRREQDLINKTDALEKLQASDKLTVASMSHELRTPLN